jgi:putative hydrolase of the HAD superfamily
MGGGKQAAIEASRVKAAVFDLGGVLFAGGPAEVVDFGARVGLEPVVWEEIRREIFGNEGIWARCERGEVSYTDFVEELRRRVQTSGGTVSQDRAADFMGQGADPLGASRLRPEIVDAVRRLRRCMPTAMLTNNVREWRRRWREALDVEELFDVIVDSSEVGTRKPEKLIYEITRERLDVAHDEIFFLDDIGQNLKAARNLGWQTLLFTDSRAVMPVLSAIIEAK